MAFRCKAGSSWLCSTLSFSVDGSASSWGIALSFLPLSLSLASSSSFLGVGRGWAEPGDTSGGGEGDCVWHGWGCAVDGGEGSCRPPWTPGDIAHLGLACLLGHLLHGGLGRGRFLHASAPLVTAGASPWGGKEEASTVSSPPLETQCWGGDGPARPAAHQAGPPGTWGTRHPPRLVWAQEGNVCAGLRLLCGDKDGWPERPRGLRFRLRPAASCCLGSALQSCLIWEMPWRSLGPPSSYARGSCGTQAWTPGGPCHPGSAGHCRKRPSLLPFLFSLLGNPQAGTLWARLIIFKVMETAFLSSAFDNLCGGSGGTWSPL